MKRVFTKATKIRLTGWAMLLERLLQTELSDRRPMFGATPRHTSDAAPVVAFLVVRELNVPCVLTPNVHKQASGSHLLLFLTLILILISPLSIVKASNTTLVYTQLDNHHNGSQDPLLSRCRRGRCRFRERSSSSQLGLREIRSRLFVSLPDFTSRSP